MNANKTFEPSQKEVRHTRRVNEWSVGHRIVGPILVMCVMSIGAARWLEPDLDVGTLMSEATTSATTEYLPARYTSQATSVEPHIEAF